MCDNASLTLPELRTRLQACIAWRLDADTQDDRTRSGHELLCVLEELARRGGLDHRGGGTGEDHLAVREVPTPRSDVATRGVLVLPAVAVDDAPARVRSAGD
jgi:hypothetical protein